MIRKIVPIIVLLSLFFFSAGCASSENISLEEKIRQVYIEHDRLDRFYELQEQYDNIRLILWINQESDSYWITNFTLWLVFSVLPDLPEVLATGGLIALIYGLAWWLGITLAGGGILALLAWVGSLFGGIPGIPPAIAGIRNHRTLQKIGFDLDIKRNGIGLPNKPGIDPFLPIHAGSHPNYTAAVARALDEIPKNLSETETRKRVNEVIDMFRKKLESGIPLHRQEGMANPWK